MSRPDEFQPGDFQAFARQLVEQFRESGGVGRLGPVDFERLVVLTTTGRRTGRPHTVPIGAARDDAGNLLLFASNMGAPRHPDWYRNIEANPRVTVEVTGASWDADAEILDGADRDDAYRRWIEMAPNVADHEQKAGRRIPMVRVRRT
jgi:deazaflavin-dependent oxidoreductase (nitroreductase family)